MKALIILLLLALLGWAAAPWLSSRVPPGWHPFTPLAPGDPPTWVTRYKLSRLADDPASCRAILQRLQQAGMLRYRQVADSDGRCPLRGAVRVERFGTVALSASFLASCPLAVRSAFWVATQAARPLEGGAVLARIDHVGSFACRNIYHRAEGRRSEHASADAWDVTGFRFAGGPAIGVNADWQQSSAAGRWLRRAFRQACPWYGNALGPDYNAAHASHFHFGLRSWGTCR
ncbi:extensin family protein [Pantoea sp. 1.19]|uniref:extensin-like domain-containing protein n=1 Tax=Pantoea sp. 1.19 TaxID=1925589 RepID=UPI000948FC25|nr:extensin family protein [Pantoea sp. 1.19]